LSYPLLKCRSYIASANTNARCNQLSMSHENTVHPIFITILEFANGRYPLSLGIGLLVSQSDLSFAFSRCMFVFKAPAATSPIESTMQFICMPVGIFMSLLYEIVYAMHPNCSVRLRSCWLYCICAG
ncbi:hypothetical protein SARC_05140, partial [Sphaeroforma arctica JP610]